MTIPVDPPMILAPPYDPQWQLRKQRPTSLGDNKHLHKISYWELEAAVKAKEAENTAQGMADRKAETILSDDGSVLTQEKFLIVDNKKETQ